MDQGHTHIDEYNLPEKNILLEDGDRPQDVPEYWPPAGIDLQGGPRNHQPLKNNASPNTSPGYSHQGLMYCTPSRSRSPGEKGKCEALNTSHERSEESQDDWWPLPNRNTATGHWEYDLSHIPHADTPSGPAFSRRPTDMECHWINPGVPRRSLWPPDYTHQTSDEFWGNYHTSPLLLLSPTPESHVEHGNT